LDDENEMRQENMYGDVDKNGGTFEERGGGEKEDNQKTKHWQENVIINPSNSSWYGSWYKLIHIALFYGFVTDPLYTAFHIAG
jgi:hypothetical protein